MFWLYFGLGLASSNSLVNSAQSYLLWLILFQLGLQFIFAHQLYQGLIAVLDLVLIIFWTWFGQFLFTCKFYLKLSTCLILFWIYFEFGLANSNWVVNSIQNYLLCLILFLIVFWTWFSQSLFACQFYPKSTYFDWSCFYYFLYLV